MFGSYNLKILHHHHHIYGCWLTNTISVYTCLVYLYTQFYTYNLSGSLVDVIKPRGKQNLCMAAVFLFYFPLNYYSTKDAHVSKIYYHMSFQDH